MKFPNWVERHRCSGREIRNIKGKYYVYKISSIWDKEKGVSRKITEKYLGRIIEEEGFIEKGKKSKKQDKYTGKVSVKEHGGSSYLKYLCSDIEAGLKQCFPDDYREIVTLGIQRLLYRTAFRNMDFLYHNSTLSDEYKDLKLNKNNITVLLQKVGCDKANISKFLGKFIAGHKHIVFDTTHIVSQSNKLGLNHIGYNSKGEYLPQVNLLYMFSTDTQLPVYYRIIPGNISGMKALDLTLKASGVKDCMLIGDKGFHSKANIELIEKYCHRYIIPLKRNDIKINYKRLEAREYDKAYDGHFFYKGRIIFYYSNLSEGVRNIVTFYDSRLRSEEEASYLHRIEKKIAGYDMEGYRKKQLTFGTLSMITNDKSLSCEEIYNKYKSRMDVEKVFDSFKNLLDSDKSYMQSEESLETWMLINHISVLLYYKVLNNIRSHSLNNNLSPQDLLLKLMNVKKLKINNSWYTSEINSRSQDLFHKLNITTVT